MNKVILIIDDDDILRDNIARGLRSNGFDVLTAQSAELGAQILHRLTVDAIVLDRMMTGQDGLSFLKDLRKTNHITPVIMLTALSGPEDTIDGLAGGANDYLAKPFQMRELVLRLNNIIKPVAIYDEKLPDGLVFIDDEFFIKDTTSQNMPPRLMGLSGEEKKLLQQLITPIGNIAAGLPMVAKRLRGKLNSVLSHTDIITIRGRGYKLVQTNQTVNNREIP